MLMLSSLLRGNKRHVLQKLTSRGIIHIAPEVFDAIARNRPVVALESTIISHGMPYPRNIEVARGVEAVIRSYGAVPATCAIINGIPKVGLNSEDLEILANPSDSNRKGRNVLKASRRDMGYAIATQSIAATTVSGTMILAHAAGIQVFATGGIGGVHRGAELSFDVSADLTELGRTPVLVVCAGVKSILDIPKTLEVLETQGIVVGVPNPSPGDSIFIQQAIDTALSCAERDGISGSKVTPYVLAMVEKLTKGASLDANVALVMSNAMVAAVIAGHLSDLKNTTSSGPSFHSVPVSPSPSSWSSSSSSSSSSTFSVSSSLPPTGSLPVSPLPVAPHTPRVVVFGAAILDVIALPLTGPASMGPNHSSPDPNSTPMQRSIEAAPEGTPEGTPKQALKGTLIMGTSNPGTVRMGYGGVGRNIAESLARLNTAVSLVSAVGDDEAGRGLLAHAKESGIDISTVKITKTLSTPVYSLEGKPEDLPVNTTSTSTSNTPIPVVAATATYTAIHDTTGSLALAIADVRVILELSPHTVQQHTQLITDSQLVVADGNLSPHTFNALLNTAHSLGVPLFFEPTSDHKCILPILTGTISKINIIKPNLSELCVMVTECLTAGYELDDINDLKMILKTEKKESSVINGLRDTVNLAVSDGVTVDNMPLKDVYSLSRALLQAMHTGMEGDRGMERGRGSVSDGHRIEKHSMKGDRNNSAENISEYSGNNKYYVNSNHDGTSTGTSSSSNSSHNINSNSNSDSRVSQQTDSSSSCHLSDSAASRGVASSCDVLGRHVLVSMGDRGVLWCTSHNSPQGTGRDPYSQSTYGAYSTHHQWCNGRTYSFTHIPAIPLNVVSTDIFDTNGAGDAFCAGFVHRLLSVQHRNRDDSGDLGGTGPGSEEHMIRSIESGLRTAHSKILSSVVRVNANKM